MMADETTPDKENAAETAATAEPGPMASDAPATEVESPDGDATALAGEVAELKNRLLRTLAEMENLRKRTEREIADQRQYAVTNFARDVLQVADNLRRALDHVPKDQRGKGDDALDALIEGVEVTERGLEQSLSKFGVRRIEAKGQKFDPAMHQAMFEVDPGDNAPGTVAEEVQAGYAIGERVLRPSLVGVYKRVRQVASAPEAEQAEAEKPAEA